MNAKEERGLRLVREYPCILTGWRGQVDLAHWPKRRSQGAGWGVLEVVPLRRDWHRRLDEGDEVAAVLVSIAANAHHARILKRVKAERLDVYLGPEERVREVERWRP
jgi:hypothetical protein